MLFRKQFQEAETESNAVVERKKKKNAKEYYSDFELCFTKLKKTTDFFCWNIITPYFLGKWESCAVKLGPALNNNDIMLYISHQGKLKKSNWKISSVIHAVWSFSFENSTKFLWTNFDMEFLFSLSGKIGLESFLEEWGPGFFFFFFYIAVGFFRIFSIYLNDLNF